ncbi:MAG: hypothetical protein PHO89_11385, partial [Methylacidiphilaceae bacterium]|nr:hypothetical protein [Candidatus Methylacidiphilaceae bacterium]
GLARCDDLTHRWQITMKGKAALKQPVLVRPPDERKRVPCPVPGCETQVIAERYEVHRHLSRYHPGLRPREIGDLTEKACPKIEGPDVDELKREFEHLNDSTPGESDAVPPSVSMLTGAAPLQEPIEKEVKEEDDGYPIEAPPEVARPDSISSAFVPCDVEGCKFRARSSLGLAIHKARAHKSASPAEKKAFVSFVCDKCDPPRTFPNQMALRAHSAIHVPEAMRTCSKCGRILGSAAAKGNHEKRCKRELGTNAPNGTTVPIEQLSSTHLSAPKEVEIEVVVTEPHPAPTPTPSRSLDETDKRIIELRADHSVKAIAEELGEPLWRVKKRLAALSASGHVDKKPSPIGSNHQERPQISRPAGWQGLGVIAFCKLLDRIGREAVEQGIESSIRLRECEWPNMAAEISLKMKGGAS